MKPGGIKRWMTAVLGMATALCATATWANPREWQLNMTKGVTPTSHDVYNLNMAALWVCVAIGVVVFAVMIVAIVRFRKSKGAVAEKWSHNTKLEVAWTIIPVLILFGLAWPASSVMTKMANSNDAGMTIKVTGYQWLWRYDYVDYMGKPVQKVGFMSRMSKDSNQTRQLGSDMDPWAIKAEDGFHDYLLNVDKELVVPVGVKIRFLITAGDVIHSWWVPDLGWKIDAIPGIVNSSWATIEKPGVYRGQCAELCGQDHAFMPIVVKAVPQAQFNKWLAAREGAAVVDKASRTAKAADASVPASGDQG